MVTMKYLTFLPFYAPFGNSLYFHLKYQLIINIYYFRNGKNHLLTNFVVYVFIVGY